MVVDLAGSEGGSTLDALPDGPEKYPIASVHDLVEDGSTSGGWCDQLRSFAAEGKPPTQFYALPYVLTSLQTETYFGKIAP